MFFKITKNRHFIMYHSTGAKNTLDDKYRVPQSKKAKIVYFLVYLYIFCIESICKLETLGKMALCM
jgi:hypothetical protein